MLKIALVQTQTRWEDKKYNTEQAEQFVINTDAELIVFPEMFTTGFTMHSPRLSEPMEGTTVNWMRDLAEKTGKALMGSVIMRSDDPKPKYYNRVIFAAPGQDVVTYDKKHLFRMGGEPSAFEPGNSRTIINYKGWRIMPIVCYDLRFPVWCRNKGDYDLLVDMACWPESRAAVWTKLLMARAIENLAYVAGVNMVGEDPFVRYSGNSAVIDYLGDVVAEASGATAQVVTAELSLENLHAFKEKFPAYLDADKFVLE